MAMQRIGDWEKVAYLISHLGEEMKKAQLQAMQRWGLKAEALAKKHIQAQDLGWTPLKPSTISAKIRKGYSENILVATSSYFQSITSWVDKDKMIAYAGVKKTAKGKDGEEIADVAATHEFGSRSGGIHARPLWQPVFAETMDWFESSDSRPSIIFMKNIKKYGV